MIDFFDAPPWDGLSNFAELEFPLIDEYGNRYWYSENYFVAMKSLSDLNFKARVSMVDPGIAKAMGRRVQLRSDWEEVKYQVMKEILVQKFAQPSFKALLLSTGDQELVEGNWWHDQIWGNCTCPEHKDTPGLNYLGKILMEIRETLR